MNSQHVRFKLPERLAATRSHGPIPAQTRLSTPSRHHRVLIKASNDNESDNQESVQPSSQPSSTNTSMPPVTDPVELVQWGGTLPDSRRLFLGTLTASAIALGGNFLGITSFLLGIDGGKTAGKIGLDSLIPVKGFKRCIDRQNGYEFMYPADWLADQRLYQRYAERLERERSLDLPSLRTPRRIRSDVPEPTAAFGPAGTTGEDNISVIVAPIRQPFKLESMGTPEEAGRRFLDSTVAPPGSDKVATLVAAGARQTEGELYYTLEFTVEAPGKFRRHNLAVYATRNGLLYTLNAQSADARYSPTRALQFARAADSFRILDSGSGAMNDFPQRI